MRREIIQSFIGNDMSIAMITLSESTRRRLVKFTSAPSLPQNALGIKGKMFVKTHFSEKVQPKRTLAMHDKSSTRSKVHYNVHEGAVPPYLLHREDTTRAKVLSNTIKKKRKEKAGKWDVPPKT